MAGDTVITIVGNLVEDPTLRFTSSGVPVASFRIASTPRSFDRQSGEWKDGETLFMSCSVWRQAAENVAESLQRGMRVIVQGRLKARTYEAQGDKRTVFEIDVEEVGPSLRSATAKVNKTQRQGGGGGGGGFGGGGGGFGGGQQGGGDGFGGGQPQGGFGGGQQGAPANDPWATGGGGGGGYNDDPPF